jgi:hypothetical protein
MTRTFAALALFALIVTPAIADDDDDECRYSADRQVVLQVDGADELRLEADAGFLRVIGEPGLTEVIAEGVACASREEYLDDIELRSGRRGSSLTLDVDLPDIDWNWNRYVRLDLTVRVPADLALDIEDGSGSMEIEGVASTTIDDGSGSIEIENIRGDLTLTDGSGSIDVRNVEGSLTVDEDGSGSMQIAGVTGDVDIDEDGSGSITIRDVGGNVRIREDGSGSIRAVEVTGDFVVDRDGSGGISVDGIGGRVEIPD